MQEGLRQTEPDQSSKTSSVDEELNTLFDDRQPESLRARGVSRVRNIYAYISSGDEVYDITDGETISLDKLFAQSEKAILRLDVDPADAHVSDLDLFDQIKETHTEGGDIDELIDAYWNTLRNLKDFTPGTIHRPEAMIIKDVPPSNITIVQRTR